MDAQVLAGLPNIGIPGTYTKVTTDSKGRVTVGTTLVATDLPSFDTTKIATGVLPIARGGTNSGTALSNGKVMVSQGGAIVEGSGSSSTSSANSFVIRDGTGSFGAALGTFDVLALTAGGSLNIAGSVSGSIGLTAPAAPSPYTLTLPASSGSSGQVLSTNGSGVTSWVPMSAATNLSDLNSAVSNKSFQNASFSQAWTWQLSANTAALTLGEFAASTGGSGSQDILKLNTLAGSTANPLHISARGSDSLIVNAAGSVGIGTSTIHPVFTAARSLQVGSAASNSSMDAPQIVVMQYAAAGSTNRPQYVGNWKSSGLWGIGPATLETVDNRLRIGHVDGGAGLYWDATQDLILEVPVINVMNPSIDSYIAGNIGVGTTTPKAKLDVNGDIRVNKNFAQPFVCDSTHDATLAITSGYRQCICNGNSGTWVLTSDGITTCTW